MHRGCTSLMLSSLLSFGKKKDPSTGWLASSSSTVLDLHRSRPTIRRKEKKQKFLLLVASLLLLVRHLLLLARPEGLTNLRFLSALINAKAPTDHSVVRPGAPFVASLLLISKKFQPNSLAPPEETLVSPHSGTSLSRQELSSQRLSVRNFSRRLDLCNEINHPTITDAMEKQVRSNKCLTSSNKKQ